MYPIESLRIIAPILLFVFIAANIVIGVFAGWKRAAYWGGGNFVFFIIGTLIWRGCSGAIVGKVEPLIRDLLSDLGVTSSISTMVKPVCAIAFGIAIILITNLILLINYYAWFKKLVKIGKYANPNWKKIKEAKKAAKKEGKKYTAPAVKAAKSDHSLKMQLINKLGGGIGFTALMLPPLFSTTTGIMYATTCTGTRYNNSFIDNFYKNMNNCNKAFSWMSYYEKDAGDNIDGLMTTLRLGTANITYTKLDGSSTTANGMSAVFDVVGTGISNVVSAITNLAEGYEEPTNKSLEQQLSEKLDNLITQFNKISSAWSSIIVTGERAVDVKVLFNSNEIMKLIPQIITKQVQSKAVIKADNWDKMFKYTDKTATDNGYFWKILAQLVDGQKITLEVEATVGSATKTFTGTSSLSYKVPTTLEMNFDCFQYLLDGMYSTLDVSQLTLETQKTTMRSVAGWMCGLMFYNEEYDIWS